jgi:hypothetical protein
MAGIQLRLKSPAPGCGIRTRNREEATVQGTDETWPLNKIAGTRGTDGR